MAVTIITVVALVGIALAFVPYYVQSGENRNLRANLNGCFAKLEEADAEIRRLNGHLDDYYAKLVALTEANAALIQEHSVLRTDNVTLQQRMTLIVALSRWVRMN